MMRSFWIAGINWITGVGEPFLSALGGANQLANNAPEGVSTIAGPHSVAFRVGSAPLAGDDRSAIGVYRALGDILQPFDYPSEDNPPMAPVFGDMMPKESLDWARRFYTGNWLGR